MQSFSPMLQEESRQLQQQSTSGSRRWPCVHLQAAARWGLAVVIAQHRGPREPGSYLPPKLSKTGKGHISRGLRQPHVDCEANLLHVGKKEDLSGPSSNICSSPSTSSGGAAEGLEADVAETLRDIPCPWAQRSTSWIIPLITGKHDVSTAASSPRTPPPAPCHSVFEN